MGGGVGGGTWEFDPHTRVSHSELSHSADIQQMLRWTLASLLSTERSPTLTGSFISPCVPRLSGRPCERTYASHPYRDLQPLPSPSFSIHFNIQPHSFSGIKVDQLKVQGDVMYKPFKGVRTVAKAGKMEVRW